MNKIAPQYTDGLLPPIPVYESLTGHFHWPQLGGCMEKKQETVEGAREAGIYFWPSCESAL